MIEVSSLGNVFVAVDPQLGSIAIGYEKKQRTIRAWDMRAQKPLWDALKEVDGIGDLEIANLTVRGRNVYLALKNKLFCLDLATGQQKWAARCASELYGNDYGLLVGDPYPPGTHGAILLLAGKSGSRGHAIYALDRESGGYLWEQQGFEGEVSIDTAEGLGTCIVRTDLRRAQIFRPESPAPVWTLEKDLGAVKPIGRLVTTVLDDDQSTADGGRNGILVFDAQTGNEVAFDPVEGLDANRVPTTIDGHVFAIRQEDVGIYAGPGGRLLPSPMQGMLVGALLAGNHTLGVYLYRYGNSESHLLGLDPQTLALKYDAGAFGHLHGSLNGEYDGYVASDNVSFVIHARPRDGVNELRSIDASTGRPLWTHPVPSWRQHYFRGGLLIVHRMDVIEVLHPATGQVIGAVKQAKGA